MRRQSSEASPVAEGGWGGWAETAVRVAIPVLGVIADPGMEGVAMGAREGARVALVAREASEGGWDRGAGCWVAVAAPAHKDTALRRHTHSEAPL